MFTESSPVHMAAMMLEISSRERPVGMGSSPLIIRLTLSLSEASRSLLTLTVVILRSSRSRSFSSRRYPGTNSHTWRSPAAGRYPSSRQSSVRKPHVFVKGSVSPSASESEISRASPPEILRNASLVTSRPCTEMSVIQIKWLTPATLTLMASSGTSNMVESIPRVLNSSWQSPTALIDVALVTTLVRTVSGLVRFNSTPWGAILLHGACDLHDHRDIPQTSEQTAWPNGVADGLHHPVAGRDLQVQCRSAESPGRDAQDHEVSPPEGFLQPLRLLQVQIGLCHIQGLRSPLVHVLERLTVDVVQDQSGPTQILVQCDVLDD